MDLYSASHYEKNKKLSALIGTKEKKINIKLNCFLPPPTMTNAGFREEKKIKEKQSKL